MIFNQVVCILIMPWMPPLSNKHNFAFKTPGLLQLREQSPWSHGQCSELSVHGPSAALSAEALVSACVRICIDPEAR